MTFDWVEASKNGEFEELDFVSNKIDVWISVLEAYRGQSASVLEIGSMEGRSALFFGSFLPDANITCIDPFLRDRWDRFSKNTAPIKDRLRSFREFSFPALCKL